MSHRIYTPEFMNEAVRSLGEGQDPLAFHPCEVKKRRVFFRTRRVFLRGMSLRVVVCMSV